MKLTDQEMNVLNKCSEDKIRLIVKGQNGLGQPFTLDGYIPIKYTPTGKNFWINNNGFGLYLGQINMTGNKKVKRCINLRCNHSGNIINPNELYVNKVISKETGELIYKNPDFKEIIDLSMTVCADQIGNWVYGPLTLSAHKLISLIGKPVINTCDNSRFVITSIHPSSQDTMTVVGTTGTYIKWTPGNTTTLIVDKKPLERLKKYKYEPKPPRPQLDNIIY